MAVWEIELGDNGRGRHLRSPSLRRCKYASNDTLDIFTSVVVSQVKNTRVWSAYGRLRDFKRRVWRINANAEVVCDFLRSHSVAGGNTAPTTVVKQVFYPKYSTPENYEYCRKKKRMGGEEDDDEGGTETCFRSRSRREPRRRDFSMRFSASRVPVLEPTLPSRVRIPFWRTMASWIGPRGSASRRGWSESVLAWRTRRICWRGSKWRCVRLKFARWCRFAVD